jgi:amino acid transporter
VAEATGEQQQLRKVLHWHDGFIVAMSIPGALFAALGYTMGSVGAWGALALWAFSSLIAVFMNWIYAELAAMFPDKPGGIALYAHEGWRKHFSLIGPIATFGYWFAWSSVLAIFGTTIGYLVQAEWFPGATRTFDVGAVDVGLPHLIGAGCVVLVWAINMLGIKPAVWLGRVSTFLLLIPIGVFAIIVFLTGDWDSSLLQWNFTGPWGGWKLAIVWLYIIGWTAYGVEVAASFAPEYRDTRRDTSLALKAAGLFTFGVFVLVPLGAGGTVSTEDAAANPIGFWVASFDQIVGGASDFMVVILIGAFLLTMNAATADGGRALYGIARDHMTIKQLYHLNHRGIPARAMTLDMIVNLALIFLIASPLAILVAGNLGYMSAHFFAVTAFLLLRKDRPHWPRPIRRHPIFVPIAVVICALNAVFIAVGASSASLSGYGGKKELWIGIGVLLISVLLFVYRRAVQDRAPIRLREDAPATPDAVDGVDGVVVPAPGAAGR